MNLTPKSPYGALNAPEDHRHLHNHTPGDGYVNQTPSPPDYDEWSLQPYSITHLFITSIILGTIILATIIGNVFVVAAIVLERNLHSVANYLIASLAVADLMVASLGMPFAAVNEVSKEWFLGPQICDVWIAVDVLCCTSSILHLVAIAMDRYWAVTQVDYIHNRSGKRILLMIALSWLISACISMPPLFGWKDESLAMQKQETVQCLISQDWGYTVFSTVGAFYLPLAVMIIIYIKIYSTAKSRIRKKNFRKLQQGPSCPNSSHAQHASTPADSTPLTQLSSSVNHSPDQSSNGSALIRSSSSGSDTNRNNNKHATHQNQQASTSPPGSPSPLLKSSAATPQLQIRSSSHCLLQPSNSPSGPLLKAKPLHLKNHSMGGSSSAVGTTCTNYTAEIPGSPGPLLKTSAYEQHASPQQRSTSFLDITKIYQDFRNKTSTSCAVQNSSPKRKERTKEKLEAKRERKAARTLAIITGSFVTCWLPFFIVAIVRPFCGESCHYPHNLISIISWLGYFNSLLNPLIYTIFNPDFRTAFRKILFGKYRGAYRRHAPRR